MYCEINTGRCEVGCCVGMWRRVLHEDVRKDVAWRGEEGCCMER